MNYPKGSLIRNGTLTRINHWITAFFFICLVLSGLSMFYPALFFLSDIFGGGQWTRAVHPWFGIGLVISFSGMVLQFWRDNLWNKSDIAWLRKTKDVMFKNEKAIPECGRFNAGQKGVFWSMVALLPILLVSGIVVWEAYFFEATSIMVQRAALLVHSTAAIAAIVIWVVHVHAAAWVRGSMWAMLYGNVSPGWAWRHHRKWLRDLVAAGSRGPTPDKPREPAE